MTRSRSWRALAVVALAALALAAGLAARARRRLRSAPAADQGPAPELRLGYFPNITHAGALIGVQNGLFAQNLGQTKLCDADVQRGPRGDRRAARELDRHRLHRLRARRSTPTSRTREGIRADLRRHLGRRPARRAARHHDARSSCWARRSRRRSSRTPRTSRSRSGSRRTTCRSGTGPGAVEVVNIDNARALDAYKTGQLDGGWLPEPYASQFVLAGAARPSSSTSGRCGPTASSRPRSSSPAPTTCRPHPATVAAFLKGLVAAEDLGTHRPRRGEGRRQRRARRRGQQAAAAQNVLDRAWSDGQRSTPTRWRSTFPQLAQDAVTAGTAQSATQRQGPDRTSARSTRPSTAAGRPTGGRRPASTSK